MQSLTSRQHHLLVKLIDEYIRLAQPVASQALTGPGGVPVSPATVRNELMELEDAGYLQQPYTSAGRLPTERAWKLYIAEVQERGETIDAKIQRTVAEHLRSVVARRPEHTVIILKDLAKALAEEFDEAIIVGFAPHDVYYTGLSHLFHQPEFIEVRDVVELTSLVDRLDEIVDQLFPTADERVQVLLGRDNPLGEHCSLLLTRYHTRRSEGVLAALGPLRQPYRHHLPLLAYARDLLAQTV